MLIKTRYKSLGVPLTLWIFLIFSLVACSGSSLTGSSEPVGASALSGEKEAGQGQATPTHFGGLENPSPDWEGCEYIGANGLPLPTEECLAKCLEELLSKEEVSVPEGTPEQQLYWCEKTLTKLENQEAASKEQPEYSSPVPVPSGHDLNKDGGRPPGKLKIPGK